MEWFTVGVLYHSLDIDDGKDVRPTETMREVYDNIAIRE